jgi:7-cyano-7-deazaguanine synthase
MNHNIEHHQGYLYEVLILLSGGLDSVACLDFYINIGRPTAALFIDYQQLAAKEEKRAAQNIADYYGIELLTASWEGVKNKKTGQISARNAFLLISALMEIPENVSTLVLGIHSGTGYIDCTPVFLKQMQQVFDLYSDQKIRITAPFIDWSKVDIWTYAKSHNIPIHLTYSCEQGTNPACGNCLSCLDRMELKTYA